MKAENLKQFAKYRYMNMDTVVYMGTNLINHQHEFRGGIGDIRLTDEQVAERIAELPKRA